MNNYRKALNMLYASAIESFHTSQEAQELAKSLRYLKELVDKSVARRVKKYSCISFMFNCAAYHFEGSACPMCRCELISKYNYCPYCGQALDWSE